MSAGQRGARTSRVGRITKASAAVRDWNARMLEEAEDGTRRGTRWGRGTCAFVPASVGIGFLGSAIASGAMAANLAVLSGGKFQLQSNYVKGSGFGAVLDNPSITDPVAGTTSNKGSARIGFAKAYLSGLCGIVTENLGGVSWTLTLTAGAKVVLSPPPGTWPQTNDVNAQDLYIETTDLSSVGSTSLYNAVLGASADTVTVDGTKMSTATNPTVNNTGLFGLAADGGTVTLEGLKTNAYDAELVGSIALPGLHIGVQSTPTGGVTSC